jgi:hypothetical protein
VCIGTLNIGKHMCGYTYCVSTESGKKINDDVSKKGVTALYAALCDEKINAFRSQCLLFGS